MPKHLLLLFSFLCLSGLVRLGAQDIGVTAEFENMDEYPRFPGCDDPAKSVEEREECAEVRLLQFIYSNLKYPDAAKAKGLQGSVAVQFTVGPDGGIANPKITKGIGEGCDDEVLRLLGMMPKWTPGKTGGAAQKADFVITVKFKIQ